MGVLSIKTETGRHIVPATHLTPERIGVNVCADELRSLITALYWTCTTSFHDAALLGELEEAYHELTGETYAP